MEQDIFIPTVCQRSNYICVYDTYEGTRSESVLSSHFVNFADNAHDLQMSTAAVKRIRQAANIMMYITKRKQRAKTACTGYRKNDDKKPANYLVTFATLTLPAMQHHSDIDFDNRLNALLVYSRKYFNVEDYVWKKELQKNGNLHYHLILDRYIDALSLRKAWNRLINAGKVKGIAEPFDYVDLYEHSRRSLYANGFKFQKPFNYDNLVSDKYAARYESGATLAECEREIYDRLYNQQYNAYLKEMSKPDTDRFKSPNTTDITAVKSVKSINAYISKYISKPIEGGAQTVEYSNNVQQIKEIVFSGKKTIKDICDNSDNPDSYIVSCYCYALRQHDAERAAELFKQLPERIQEIFLSISKYTDELRQYRAANCPIHGKLWYRSKRLGLFDNGCRYEVDIDSAPQIDRVIKILRDKEAKTGRKYILHNEDINVLCLLIDTQELHKYGLKFFYDKYNQYVDDCLSTYHRV